MWPRNLCNFTRYCKNQSTHHLIMRNFLSYHVRGKKKDSVKVENAFVSVTFTAIKWNVIPLHHKIGNGTIVFMLCFLFWHCPSLRFSRDLCVSQCLYKHVRLHLTLRNECAVVCMYVCMYVDVYVCTYVCTYVRPFPHNSVVARMCCRIFNPLAFCWL